MRLYIVIILFFVSGCSVTEAYYRDSSFEGGILSGKVGAQYTNNKVNLNIRISSSREEPYDEVLVGPILMIGSNGQEQEARCWPKRIIGLGPEKRYMAGQPGYALVDVPGRISCATPVEFESYVVILTLRVDGKGVEFVVPIEAYTQDRPYRLWGDFFPHI